jgi:hypothetical protein
VPGSCDVGDRGSADRHARGDPTSAPTQSTSAAVRRTWAAVFTCVTERWLEHDIRLDLTMPIRIPRNVATRTSLRDALLFVRATDFGLHASRRSRPAEDPKLSTSTHLNRRNYDP